MVGDHHRFCGVVAAGFIFIGLNNAMKKGKLGGLEQKAHDRVQGFNKVSTTPVYAAQSRPVYEQGAQTPNAASAKPQMQGKKEKTHGSQRG